MFLKIQFFFLYQRIKEWKRMKKNALNKKSSLIIPVIRILVQTHSKMSCTSERFQFPSPLDKEDLTLIQSGHAVIFWDFHACGQTKLKNPPVIFEWEILSPRNSFKPPCVILVIESSDGLAKRWAGPLVRLICAS